MQFNKNNFLKKYIIIFASLVLLLSVYLIYYFLYISAEKVELISPDKEIHGKYAYKKKPEDPGGLHVAHSNSHIYDLINEPSRKNNITISAAPEEPIYDNIFRHFPGGDTKFADSIDQILNNIEYYEDKVLSYGDNADDADNDYIDSALPAAKPTRKTPKNNLDVGSVDISKNRIYGQKIRGNKVNIEGSELNIIKTDTSKPKLLSNANQTKKHISGYKLQLATALSEQLAKKLGRKIREKNLKILKSSNLILRKIESVEGRFFFLVLAGSYQSESKAKLRCKQLISRKQNCIVVK